MEQTLAIVKPDAVESGRVGAILARIEREGFRIAALKMIHLSRQEAERFYAVHKERAFFSSLTAFMSSGPVVVMVLGREDAVKTWRRVMGCTDPAEAEASTLRAEYGSSIERNATHGSDARETAAQEISYFFSRLEICSKI
ncbi:MAG: nucleoside-diphosphate kinase [Acidobacteriota bacterium]